MLDEHDSLQWYDIVHFEHNPMRAYAQSGQYHIIVENRVHLINPTLYC